MIVGALAGLIMFSAQPSPERVMGAATFTVNKRGNAADLNVGDGRCDTSTTTGKQCTLRAAIQEANATGAADVINFKIGSTSKTIAPTTQLPAITNPLTINGYSQPGTSVNGLAVGNNAVLKIVLDGVNAGAGATGLRVQSHDTRIRGLVIQRWDGAGIELSDVNSTVDGNFIGTTPAGSAARPNRIGIRATGSGHLIGGAATTARNLVSGNSQSGIVFEDAALSVIAGNYIGTTKSGSGDLGNKFQGIIVLNSTKMTIGGTLAGTGNVISANDREAIATDGMTLSVIKGNLIGTDATGTDALGNDGDGVSLLNSDANEIGGSTAVERNTISDNQIAIKLNQSNSNAVRGNRIGTRSDGTGNLGNRFGGISVGGEQNTIGGAAAGADNLIANTINAEGILLGGPHAINNVIRGNSIVSNAEEGIQLTKGPNEIIDNTIVNNGGDGVRVDNFITGNPTGIRISANQIFGNGGLGIDLGSFAEGALGVTANDSGDGDVGPNNLQNYPVLSQAVRQPNGVTVVGGSLNSLASTEFIIELFVVIADASGHGEAQSLLDTQTITTDGGGNDGFQFVLGTVAAGQQLTATAINTTTGDTSEFSTNVVVVQQ